MLGVAIHNTNDVADLLPPTAGEKFRRLRDGVTSSYAVLRATLDNQQDARQTRQAADQRIRFLKAPPAGGKAVAADHPDYVATQRILERTAAELARLQGIHHSQQAVWNTRARLVRDVEQAVREAQGRFCTITPIAAKPVLRKGEDIATAIESRRRRGRELAADLNRVQSAPIKSVEAKRKMRLQIDMLAERGRPYTAGLVERGSEIEFADTQRQALARGEHAAHVGWVEPDAMATFAWLHRDALVKKLETEIDAEADDEHAVDDKTRAAQIEVITRDMQAVEYEEAALVWEAQDAGLPCDHRADISPAALLGVAIGESRPAPVPGTSPHHVIEVREPQRGRAVIPPSSRG